VQTAISAVCFQSGFLDLRFRFSGQASTVRERTKKQIQNEMKLAADCPAGGLFPELIAEPPQNLKAS
jgi:hypothetical protein